MRDEELRVPGLVLDLCGERQLPLQGRGAEIPVALRQHAHQLGVRVPISTNFVRRVRYSFGIPVTGLDETARLHVREELVGAGVHTSMLPNDR